MINRNLQAIAVDDYEAVAVMTVKDLLDVALPARDFLPTARLSPLDQREVDRLRALHDLIQRDFSGEKRRNAQGLLADYIRDQWLPPRHGVPTTGILGPFTLCFAEPLEFQSDTWEVTLSGKGFFLDGESRGEALLVNVERMTTTEVDRLLSKQVAVHIVHGITDARAVAKYFADINGKGVKVNPNLVAMADYTDPYAEIAKRVFARLGLELETRQRQVRATSGAVMTGLQARLMVAAIARGVGVIQFGSKLIPSEGIDLAKLESVADDWVGELFTAFPPQVFRDKALIVRAVPVVASMAALGKAFYSGDVPGQKRALAVLEDSRIDWNVGDHWVGVAGKINKNTNRFAIGGGKEYGYATWRALSDPKSAEGRQIRAVRARKKAA